MALKIMKKSFVILVAVLFSLILIVMHSLSSLGMYFEFIDIYEGFTLILMVGGISGLAAVTFLVKRKNRLLLLLQVLIFAFIVSLDVLFQFSVECFFYDYLDFENSLLIIGNVMLSCVLIMSIKFIYSSSWGRLGK